MPFGADTFRTGQAAKLGGAVGQFAPVHDAREQHTEDEHNGGHGAKSERSRSSFQRPLPLLHVGKYPCYDLPRISNHTLTIENDMKHAIAWGLLALLVAGCASSGQPTTSSNPQQVVCKREATTGSHTTKRVCRTVAQIEAERESARKAMAQRRSINTGAGQ